MERAYLEIIYLCGLILQVILVWPFIVDFILKKHSNFFNKKELRFLLYIGIGFIVLPLIYVFSTWFSYFDYNLPKWLGFPSTILYCFGVWLLFTAYKELGPNWSPGPETREDHLLITTGTYKWVRHPIYASYLLISVDQMFMLQNWLVGPAFLLLATPFFLYRVKREEQHLIHYFGDEYLNYKNQTNALLPKMEQFDFEFVVSRLKFLKKNKG